MIHHISTYVVGTKRSIPGLYNQKRSVVLCIGKISVAVKCTTKSPWQISFVLIALCHLNPNRHFPHFIEFERLRGLLCLHIDGIHVDMSINCSMSFKNKWGWESSWTNFLGKRRHFKLLENRSKLLSPLHVNDIISYHWYDIVTLCVSKNYFNRQNSHWSMFSLWF